MGRDYAEGRVANMMAAYHRVVANGGAAGVDGMTVGDLKGVLVAYWPRIREDLLAGRYRPQPVRRVDIPKPGGGTRPLGESPSHPVAGALTKPSRPRGAV